MSARGPVSVETFGCRLNAWESEVMRDHLSAAGRSDVVVINTCAVTAEAERQARQAIRRARRERPEAEIVVTGCAAQIAPEAWADMPEVSRVVGNVEKLKAETWLPADAPRVAVADIMGVRETAGHLVTGFGGRARAFVQVQQGCDHRCTFCVIPFGRGNARSVPVGGVVDQVRALVEAGYREVVLTGVDLTSWGGDLPGTPLLGQLVRRLLALVPDLPRLRLSSVDAVEIDDELMRLFAEEPRLMPHLHLSAQAGDDMILKRMKRRHSRADMVALVRRLRDLRPGIAFGADLIAGFPTETEAMFENTLALVEECDLAHLHVFPYSPRPMTPAARMPQVPVAVRKERAARLHAAGDQTLARHLARRLGTTDRVLIEKQDANGLWSGHGEDFAPVVLDAAIEGKATEGALLDVTIRAVEGDRLLATRTKRAAA